MPRSISVVAAALLSIAIALGIVAIEVGRDADDPDDLQVATTTPSATPSATPTTEPTPQSVRGRDEPFASNGPQWARALLVGSQSTGLPRVAVTESGTLVTVAEAIGFQPNGAWAYTDFRPNPTGTPLEFHGGDSDIVLAAFDADGTGLWSRSFGGPGTDYGGSVAVAADGDILLSGTYTDTLDLGGGPLPVEGPRIVGWRDGFLARLDPEGNLRWAQTFGWELSSSAGSVVELADGSIVMVGFSSAPEITLGDHTIEADGEPHAFLVSFTPDGDVQWATLLDTSSAGRMVVDATTNEVVIVARERIEDRSGFVFQGLVRVSAEGQIVSRSAPPIWPDGEIASLGVAGLAIDVDGSIVIGGTFEGEVSLGGDQLIADGFDSPYARAPRDGYVARFAADGTHLMSRQIGLPRERPSDGVHALALADGGDILIAGTSYLARLDSDGNLLSDVPFPDEPSARDGIPEGVTVSGTSNRPHRVGALIPVTDEDGEEHVIISGRFSYRLGFAFGGRVLTKRGVDAFIARIEAP